MQSAPISAERPALIAALIFALSGVALILLGLKGLWNLQFERVYGLALFQVWFVAGAVISGGVVLLILSWSLRGTTPSE